MNNEDIENFETIYSESDTFEFWVNDNEEKLLELWDKHKYEKYSELFDQNEVDFFDEELFKDMCLEIYENELD